MNWYERQPAGNVNAYWLSCAIDADGSNLIAGCTRLYTSANGGVSWTERRPAGDIDKNWFGVASDDDGSNLIVGAKWGRLYTSSDGGANWTERRPAGDVDATYAWCVASDADGSNLIAANQGKRIYISTDGGENWTETTPTGTAEDWGWSCCASDDDGSVLIVGAMATGANTGSLFVSTNGGTSWTERKPTPISDYPVDETDTGRREWQAVACDADGSTLVAGMWTGWLYTSIDYGVNWTVRYPVDDMQMYRSWWGAASNADGSVLMVGAYTGRFYVSNDGGATWEEQRPGADEDGTWYAVDIDDAGRYAIAANREGRLYTIFNPPPPKVYSFPWLGHFQLTHVTAS